MKIQLTDTAIAKGKSYLAQEEQKKGLRIYVEGGGCSGFQYGFSVDEAAEDDLILEFSGLTVLIDPISAPYIATSVIDYNEGLMNAGFVVRNPNAKATCGCGSSFSMG